MTWREAIIWGLLIGCTVAFVLIRREMARRLREAKRRHEEDVERRS